MKYKNRQKRREARIKEYKAIEDKMAKGMIPAGAFKKPGSMNK